MGYPNALHFLITFFFNFFFQEKKISLSRISLVEKLITRLFVKGHAYLIIPYSLMKRINLVRTPLISTNLATVLSILQLPLIAISNVVRIPAVYFLVCTVPNRTVPLVSTFLFFSPLPFRFLIAALGFHWWKLLHNLSNKSMFL